MPIYATRNEGSKFEQTPEGLWPGVCCDVVDLGMQPTQWGEKHKVQFRWLLDARPKRADQKPYMITKRYTLSLHEKSNLYQMLSVWLGKATVAGPRFDLESLVGRQCQIQVAQETGNDGETYSFPQVIMKPATKRIVPVPDDYVRVQDRPGYEPPELPAIEGDRPEVPPTTDEDVNYQPSDDDVPF
jgi:hypothetical protein